MKNNDVKMAIKESNHYQWEVAEMLGVSEGTFCKQLRKELSEEKKQQIFEAIEKLNVGQGV